MKKLVLLITILFVSVLTTACINNLAVQELNNKAKESLQNGDSETAICRLKSSLDLDSNMYETHYNLAVAYISAKKYDEAVQSLETVLKLKPDFSDAYYSLGVANEEKAFEIINGEQEQESDQTKSETPEKKQELTNQDKQLICDKIAKAIENYNTYLSKKESAQDKEKVNERINVLNGELKKYNLSDNNTMQAQ
jgi:tetratricopeptide (TPR) repeat protein